jgi:hypothetical protein
MRFSDDAVLYTFTGAGEKSFTVGANFDTEVYFRRETSTGTVLMRTLPATQRVNFGNNGFVALFYGAEVQLAQSSEVLSIKAAVDAYLDVAVSTRLAAASYTAPDNAGVAANGVAIAALNDLSSADVTAALNAATVDANVIEIKGLPLNGAGVLGDEFRVTP